MIHLKEIDQSNFNECIALKRKSEKFVGNAVYVLAEGYTFKHHSTTHGIYNDDIMVGMVTVMDKPSNNRAYGFTNMFIADNYQRKGYGKQAVAVILDKFQKQRKADTVELCVHESNKIALSIYKNFGFIEIGREAWNNKFIKLLLVLS